MNVLFFFPLLARGFTFARIDMSFARNFTNARKVTIIYMFQLCSFFYYLAGNLDIFHCIPLLKQ